MIAQLKTMGQLSELQLSNCIMDAHYPVPNDICVSFVAN